MKLIEFPLPKLNTEDATIKIYLNIDEIVFLEPEDTRERVHPATYQYLDKAYVKYKDAEYIFISRTGISLKNGRYIRVDMPLQSVLQIINA